MSREIKFRVWDNIDNSWCSETEYWINGVGVINYVDVPVGPDDDFTIEIFTGLYDKKNKEICENDIVKVERLDSLPSFNKVIVVYADNHGAFLLQYIKSINPKGIIAKYSDITSTDKKTLFGSITGWKLEVIGNIHEHKDLLEQGQ